MVDLTRKKDFAQKKTSSVATARIEHADIATADGTALHELYNLPNNAVIKNAMVVVEVAGQTNLTVDFGFDGGNELGNDLDIDGAAVVSVTQSILALTLTEGVPNTLSAGTVSKSPMIATGTGKNVTAKFSAKPTAGTFVFIVEFIEYDIAVGTYMNYTA